MLTHTDICGESEELINKRAMLQSATIHEALLTHGGLGHKDWCAMSHLPTVMRRFGKAEYPKLKTLAVESSRNPDVVRQRSIKLHQAGFVVTFTGIAKCALQTATAEDSAMCTASASDLLANNTNAYTTLLHYVAFCFLPMLTSRLPSTQLTAKTARMPAKKTKGFLKRAENGYW
jgi:hypothetical protein